MTARDDLARTLAEHRIGVEKSGWSGGWVWSCGRATGTAPTRDDAQIAAEAHLASVVSRRDADLRTRIEAIDDPRVQVDSYVVRPAGYDDFANSDRDYWCLSVTNGHAWGSVRRFGMTGQEAMNRKGEWIYESRGSGRNKPRRWSRDEALSIALANVDTHRINGHTAAEASAWVAARWRRPADTDTGRGQ